MPKGVLIGVATYKKLIEDSLKYNLLMDGAVYNWDGYKHALIGWEEYYESYCIEADALAEETYLYVEEDYIEPDDQQPNPE